MFSRAISHLQNKTHSSLFNISFLPKIHGILTWKYQYELAPHTLTQTNLHTFIETTKLTQSPGSINIYIQLDFFFIIIIMIFRFKSNRSI